jgi:hypothetical protein
MASLIFFIICLLLNYIIDDYNKPVVSEIDQTINTIIEKKPVKYISNGVVLNTTLKRHYFDILDMENGKVYNREMISEQVFKQHSFYNEDVRAGYKTRCNTTDIHLAEDYTMNYYDYVVHLN